MTTPEELMALVGKLTPAQRHFVIMASGDPVHPYDIDVNGLVCKALVTRGLAYRTLCRTPVTDEGFNGYGLTRLGLQAKAALKSLAEKG